VSVRPLPSLLAESREAGAFFLTERDLEALNSAAREAGLHAVTLDLAGCDGKAGLLRRVAAAFDFPDHFGHNWDALEDCLRDLGWIDAPGYVVGIAHSGALRAASGDDYATFVSILEDSSDYWRERGLPFWAFIALPDDDFEAL